MILLIKLQALACNFTKSIAPPKVFFNKSYKASNTPKRRGCFNKTGFNEGYLIHYRIRDSNSYARKFFT